MEAKTGFQPAGEVIDYSQSLAGSDYSHTPGLPVRPNNSNLLFPIDVVGGEATSSASAGLARALGRNFTGEMSDAIEEPESVETRDARRPPTPLDPTAVEVENHKLTGHAVFRSWCRHCVRGRGREAAHTQMQIGLKDRCLLSVGTAAISAPKGGAQDIAVTPQSPLFWSCLTAGVRVYMLD